MQGPTGGSRNCWSRAAAAGEGRSALPCQLPKGIRRRRNTPIVLFAGQGKSGFEVGTCVFDVAEIPHRDAPVVERPRILRSQPDRLVVIPDGSCVIAENTFRGAPFE